MTRLREDIFPCAKAKKGNKKTLLRREGSFATSPFALTGGFSFFLTLNAGLFIMLAFTDFLKDAAAGALPLKPFERTFQGLIFADTYLGHCYPSPRSLTPCQQPATRTDGKTMVVLYSETYHESTLFGKIRHPGDWIRPCVPPSACRRGYGSADEGRTGTRRNRNSK